MGLMSPNDWYNIAYNTSTAGIKGQEQAFGDMVRLASVSKLMRDLRREEAANQAMAEVSPYKIGVDTDYSKVSGGLLPEEQVYGVPDQGFVQTPKNEGEMVNEAAMRLRGKGLFTEARTLLKGHNEDVKAQTEALNSGITTMRRLLQIYGPNAQQVIKANPVLAQTGLGDIPMELGHGNDLIVKDPRTGQPLGVWAENIDSDGKVKQQFVKFDTPAMFQEYILAEGDPKFMKHLRERTQATTKVHVSTGEAKRDRVQAVVDDDGNVSVVNLDKAKAKSVEGVKGKTASKKGKRTYGGGANTGNSGAPSKLTYDPNSKTFK